MKTYKGFNKDMTCRGFQYEEGKEYEHDGAVVACESGFHACEAPLDCFKHYAPASSVYHEVEQDGKISREKNATDTKVASSKIKIGARLNIFGLVQAQVEYVKSKCTMEHTDPKMATAGEYGAATAGDRGAATAGDRGAATAGNCGAATAGDRGAATAGYRGVATSRGIATVGNIGIACVRGNNVKAKGGLGSVLVLVEENKNDYNIAAWKAFVVDGDTYKADTFYRLVNGEITETE